MGVAVGLVLVALSFVLLGCENDAEIDQAGLEEARGELERQERREARAQARLEATREQARAVGAGGVSAAVRGDIATAFETYTSSTAGWSAEVPTGSGWSEALETEPTRGRLFRTEFAGPGGAVLIIDASPFDSPSFSGAPVDSRATVDHPVYGPMEKIIFQGNSEIDFCESGLCVDYLIRYGEGGYAVLGGGGEISEIEALAERVAMSLRYYDL